MRSFPAPPFPPVGPALGAALALLCAPLLAAQGPGERAAVPSAASQTHKSTQWLIPDTGWRIGEPPGFSRYSKDPKWPSPWERIWQEEVISYAQGRPASVKLRFSEMLHITREANFAWDPKNARPVTRACCDDDEVLEPLIEGSHFGRPTLSFRCGDRTAKMTGADVEDWIKAHAYVVIDGDPRRGGQGSAFILCYDRPGGAPGENFPRDSQDIFRRLKKGKWKNSGGFPSLETFRRLCATLAPIRPDEPIPAGGPAARPPDPADLPAAPLLR